MSLRDSDYEPTASSASSDRSVLREFTIEDGKFGGCHIEIVKVDPKSTAFIGQKLLHLFNMVPLDPKSKKSCYGSDFTSIYAKEAISDPEGIYIKFDGSCGYLAKKSETNIWTMFTRVDLSFDKSGNLTMFGKVFKNRDELPSALIQCEADPRIGIQCEKYESFGKLHWPFMVPIATSVPTEKSPITVLQTIQGVDTVKNYIWNLKAFQNAVTSGKLAAYTQVTSMSVEQMGKQLNLKVCDDITDLVIVPHNTLRINIPSTMHNFEGLCELMKYLPNAEGVVIYGKNGTVWKFRREMVKMSDGTLLQWPGTTEKNDWAMQVALV